MEEEQAYASSGIETSVEAVYKARAQAHPHTLTLSHSHTHTRTLTHSHTRASQPSAAPSHPITHAASLRLAHHQCTRQAPSASQLEPEAESESGKLTWRKFKKALFPFGCDFSPFLMRTAPSLALLLALLICPNARAECLSCVEEVSSVRACACVWRSSLPPEASPSSISLLSLSLSLSERSPALYLTAASVPPRTHARPPNAPRPACVCL
jgi:hypothetical protein